MACLSLWAGRERTSCWFLSFFFPSSLADRWGEDMPQGWDLPDCLERHSFGARSFPGCEGKLKYLMTDENAGWGKPYNWEREFFLALEIRSHAACVLGSVFWNQTACVTLLAFPHRWPALTRWKECRSACCQSAVGWAGSCGQGEPAALSHMNLVRAVVGISSAPGRKGPHAVPRLSSPYVLHMIVLRVTWSGEFRFEWKLVCVSSPRLM